MQIRAKKDFTPYQTVKKKVSPTIGIDIDNQMSGTTFNSAIPLINIYSKK